jgi:colanic acid/amylovoran biosynthesis glycosyltransferase
LEDSLKSLSDSLGLTKKEVTFLGSIPHAEVAAFMQSLDAFVLPCREDANGDIDGIPVVLMEAMLMGVPVITSKLSGIPELVINQQTGLLVKPNDSDELASAVLSMMGDDKLRERMCAGAVSRVKSEFSLIVNTKILHGMFSAVINGNK